MQINLPFGIYRKKLQQYSNDPVCLSVLLKPFGISVESSEVDESLCIGLILEHMSQSFYNFDCIDPMDLAEAAWKLGFKPAGAFLDTGPLLLMKLLMEREANRNF